MADQNPVSMALQAMSTNAAKPERSEPGPGEVGPTTETKSQNPLVPVKMEEAEVNAWWDRIAAAESRIDQRSPTWDILLTEYLPKVSASGQVEDVKVNAHFRNVHTKIGNLFYRSPDLILSANDPSPAQNMMPPPPQPPPLPGQPPPPPAPPHSMEEIIMVKQEVLNKTLGRDGIKVNRLMDELLFDVLAWAGIGVAKIGYRCVMKGVQQPRMGPAPQQPGSMLGLQQLPPVPQVDAMGQTVMDMVKVPIHEEFYARRVAPKKFLCNADLKSTRFDEDATFMGMRFFMAPDKAMKAFGLTEQEAAKAAEDTLVYQYPEDKAAGETIKLVEGVELFVKSSFFTDEVHPLAMHQLIFIKGVKERPVVWRPSPDQEFEGPMLLDPATGQPTGQPNPRVGQLTKDSLIGFPYKVLTIRDLADSAFPPSDAAMVNSQVKQLNTNRRQSVRLRDSAAAKYLVDGQYLEDEDVEKVKNGEVGEFLILKDGALAGGADKVIAPMVQVHASPDDTRTAQMLKQDLDETLGISNVQAGQTNDTIHSATEVRDVSNAVQARNEKERSRAVDFFLDIARGIDTLLMRYADQDLYQQITGNDGAQKMMVWNHQKYVGAYLYDIAPDSQMQPDTAREFQLLLNFYNQAAKDPLFNRAYVMRKLARMRGLDPNKLVLPPPPPAPPQPEPLKMTLSVTADDLLRPEVQLFIATYGPDPAHANPTLAVSGHPQPQPEHGGANTPGETVSQHAASNSGGAENAPGALNHRETQVK